ncbi:hypothetical protein GCM10009119_07840 [Algoriphagus jejuensis]|uniref:Uncharacterized protein n=1 Tax=Algoriphagus jejuensis TaxID=419934 RepID=A0ABP3Y8M5_9BACT
MKNLQKAFGVLFLALTFFACDGGEDMNPDDLLDQVGFEGRLPDGRSVTFPSSYQPGSEPIAFSFKTDQGGAGKTYQGNVITHTLGLKDLDRGYSLFIRLPELKWSQEATSAFNSKAVFEEIYSYDKVKELLAVGEKKINVVDFDYDRADFGAVPDFFQIQYVPEGNQNTIMSGLYNPFFHEGKFVAPTDNFLRVVSQREGSYVNEKGESKRLLLVEFELKLQMYEVKSAEGYVPLQPLAGRLVVAFKEFVPEWAK